MHARPLRSLMFTLLASTTLLSFMIVAVLMLMLRLPNIEQDAQQSAKRAARKVDLLLNYAISDLEELLRPLAPLEPALPDDEFLLLMQTLVQKTPEFENLYLIDYAGNLQLIAGSDASETQMLLNHDLSNSPLFERAASSIEPVWDDRFISPSKGGPALALGISTGSKVLIAETRTQQLNAILEEWLTTIDERIMVVDRYDNLLVDNQGLSPDLFQNSDIRQLLSVVREGEEIEAPVMLVDHKVHLGYALFARTGWVILAGAATGFGNPVYRITIYTVALTLLASLVIVVAIAPFWSRLLGHQFHALMAHSRRVSAGDISRDWPEGSILELNRLSFHLKQMSESMQTREQGLTEAQQQLADIFENSPSPMTISQLKRGSYRVIQVNRAWCRLFGWSVKQATDQTGDSLEIWGSQQDRARIIDHLSTEGAINQFSVWLKNRNQADLICTISAKALSVGEVKLLIFVYDDVTHTYHLQQQLSQFKRGLEQQVELRTADLAASNQALQQTLDKLQKTQTELVRSEKLAALGSMVAGIAHELNTPLGSGNLAISGLKASLNSFTQIDQRNLTRSSLEQFLTDVEDAVEIGSRNLNRAAELVSTFKQVAADRTSSQRRRFLLQEVVDEVLLTLRPVLKHTPYQVHIEIEPQLRLDSYPGPLGQVLTNLINNALLHGLNGRDHGRIELIAKQDQDLCLLQLSDDGHGMSSDIQRRIFDPFFTTRSGSGGTGLGMHVSHNIVVNILGGTLQVESAEQQGAQFFIKIPLTAPSHKEIEPQSDEPAKKTIDKGISSV